MLAGGLAWFEWEVAQIVMTGDHELVIGTVVNGGAHLDGDALTLKAMGWSYGE